MINQTHIGLARESQQEVTRDRTAAHVGSGSLGVYATPAMLAFIEATCRDLLAELLDESQTSVGTAVELKHLAPTPEGETLHVRVEIADVDGIMVVFNARVWDRFETIGEARHTRAVVDVTRFMKRLQRKLGKSGSPLVG